MFSPNSFCSNNSWVICLEWLGRDECVLVGWDELSLVVGASISKHKLRWVLIWHHHCWLWKSWSECVGMIWLKGFLQHTSMEILSNLELILRKGSYFWESLAVEIDWLRSTICECKADGLSILLEDFTAWCNFSILEHLCWVSYFILMDCISLIKSILSGCWCCLFLCLCRLLFLYSRGSLPHVNLAFSALGPCCLLSAY